MQIIDVIRTRRSIRKYTAEDVSDDIVRTLIDAARWAPSAGNLQPWDFIVIRVKETKKRLSKIAYDQQFIIEAPVVIVACTNPMHSSSRYGLRGASLYCLMDVAFAIQNILLTAHSLGLGTCVIGAFNEEEVKKILGIPDECRPVAIVPVGYPAEDPKPPMRRTLTQIIHNERF